jgi:hypothetical protein
MVWGLRDGQMVSGGVVGSVVAEMAGEAGPAGKAVVTVVGPGGRG